MAAEEAEEARLFQTERTRIIRALLMLACLVTTFFLALALVDASPHFPWLPILTDADMLLLAFWLDRRPQDYLWVSRLFLFPSVGLILLDVMGWPTDVLVPPLVFLPTMAYFAVLLDGPRAGLVLALVELAFLGFYYFFNPQPGAAAIVVRSNLLLVAPGYLLIGWVVWGQFRDLGRAVTARAGALKELTEECDRILATIFQSLEEKVSETRHLLRDLKNESLPLLRDQVKSMGDLLRGFTNRSLGVYHEQLPASEESLLDQARLKMIRIFAGGILTFFIVGGLRNFYYFRQIGLILFASIAFLGLFYISFGKSKFKTKTLPWVFALSLFLAFIPAIFYWGRLFLAPPLFVIPIFVVVASLTGPLRMGLAALGLYLAVLSWYFLSPVDWTQSQFYTLIYLCILAPDLLAGGWIFWRLRHRRLENLGVQTEGYYRSLRMRRRLMGTLLHDMRNPLVVLTSLVGEKTSPKEWGPVRDMVDRMADILQSGRTLLDVEGLVPRHHLKPVEWRRMVEQIQALFSARLREKEISLETGGDPAFKALALPDLLVNSILANLLSNALKFSARGSIIRMEALLSDEEFILRISDQGQGFSSAQLEAFRKGQRLDNSPGTEGEPGTGLGLFLSRDYARFMGGDLELSAREGGGTVAVLRLIRT